MTNTMPMPTPVEIRDAELALEITAITSDGFFLFDSNMLCRMQTIAEDVTVDVNVRAMAVRKMDDVVGVEKSTLTAGELVGQFMRGEG